jgi:Cu2+-containing amine oxidase
VAITDSLIRHPLDALTTDEIETAVALVRGENRLSARARFALVWLSEPAKDLVRGFKDGDPVPREIARIQPHRHHSLRARLETRRTRQGGNRARQPALQDSRKADSDCVRSRSG